MQTDRNIRHKSHYEASRGLPSNADSNPRGRIFLSSANTRDIFIVLHVYDLQCLIF